MAQRSRTSVIWCPASGLSRVQRVNLTPPSRPALKRMLPDRPRPQRGLETDYSSKRGLKSIVERKLRRGQLREGGNVEISGRDLRMGAGSPGNAQRTF
jgi:hypothetical protein